jgi:hypothetical protein
LSLERFAIADSQGGKDLACLMIAGGHSASDLCNRQHQDWCGMADYQLRLWNAWHHHMALVMMAMLFMLSEKLRMQEQRPLLSCADIERLLASGFPSATGRQPRTSP